MEILGISHKVSGRHNFEAFELLGITVVRVRCAKACTGRLAATVAKLLHTPTAVARIIEISAEPFTKTVDGSSAEYYLCRKCLAGRSRKSDTGDWRFNEYVGFGAI